MNHNTRFLGRRDVMRVTLVVDLGLPQDPSSAGSPEAIEALHCRVLGVWPGATDDEIQSSYRALISKYHPDKVGHLGEEFQQLAREKTREIMEAYEFFQRKRRFR